MSESYSYYEPRSFTLDGKEFTALLKVSSPSKTSWAEDVREWERLIAIQVVVHNSWGPQSCKFVRKQLRLRKPELAKALALPIQVIEEVESGSLFPPEKYTRYLTEGVQDLVNSLGV